MAKEEEILQAFSPRIIVNIIEIIDRASRYAFDIIGGQGGVDGDKTASINVFLGFYCHDWAQPRILMQHFETD